MRFVRAVAASLALLSGSAALAFGADADDEPIRTVRWDPAKFSHGEPFEVECERGSYLVGFEGQAGDWIDNMRLVCARWNAARSKLEARVTIDYGQIGQSRGGEATREVCSVGSGIAGDYGEHYARDEDIYVLHTLEFYCVVATDGMRPLWRKFGSTSPIENGWEKPDAYAGCPEGYLATGVYGRAGHFIDRFFGFVCRHRPIPSAVAETRPPYGSAARAPGAARTSMGNVSGMMTGGAAAPDTPPPSTEPPSTPPPQQNVDMVRVKSDTDVYRKTGTGRFVRTDDDPSHFLDNGFQAQLLAKEGGWWKLALNNVPWVPGGEGWVWGDDLELLPN